MNEQQQNKIVQYLNEAHATELALVRELQAQIAMTPSGRYRNGLEKHLQETRQHAQRVEERLGELAQGSNPLQVGVGVFQSVAGQALAVAKTPLNLIRGSGGEEKVLKNAKDSCAAEALEIATYTSLARLANAVGDQKTERLAKSVLEDEQRMLKRVLDEIPRLTDAVARAEFDDDGSYDVTDTGAAKAVRKAGGKAKQTARQARKAPGVARAEGTVKGAVASESDLAIANYDSLSVEEIQDKLSELSQSRPGQGQRLRAQEPEPLDRNGPDRLPAGRRAVDRIRRARRGRSARRAFRGRRAADQGRARLRAQAQGTGRSHSGDRARADEGLAAFGAGEGAQQAPLLLLRICGFAPGRAGLARRPPTPSGRGGRGRLGRTR